MTPRDRKIQEATAVLHLLKLDELNPTMAPLVLLAFLCLKPGDSWHEADPRRLTITEVMQFMADHYGAAYAPNTRESVRFSVVYPFLNAGLLVRNPDQPDRPATSPKYCYQLEPNTAALLRLKT